MTENICCRVDSLPRDGGEGGDEEGEGRLQAGAARPLPPGPVRHHPEVLARGHEQEARLLRAQKGEKLEMTLSLMTSTVTFYVIDILEN